MKTELDTFNILRRIPFADLVQLITEGDAWEDLAIWLAIKCVKGECRCPWCFAEYDHTGWTKDAFLSYVDTHYVCDELDRYIKKEQ